MKTEDINYTRSISAKKFKEYMKADPRTDDKILRLLVRLFIHTHNLQDKKMIFSRWNNTFFKWVSDNTEWIKED